jgi:putative DNA primase/helicase
MLRLLELVLPRVLEDYSFEVVPDRDLGEAEATTSMTERSIKMGESCYEAARQGQVRYPRQTVFAATVNDANFLVDATGNRRWWTIAVKKMRWKHDIDMQQLYAQLAVELAAGERWWLAPAEERLLAEYNLRHRNVSAIAERVWEYIDPKSPHPGKWMTAMEVLRTIGITNPTNPQCKECSAVLREAFGPSSRVNGRDRWRVRLRLQGFDDES